MRALLLVLLATVSLSCGEATSPAPAPDQAAVTQSVDPSATECVTCSRGLGDPSCNLCAVCKSRLTQGMVLASVSGCLPIGTWCANPTASTCVRQACADCP